jgi:hypothetical protein
MMGAVDKPQQKSISNAGVLGIVAIKTGKSEFSILQGSEQAVQPSNAPRPALARFSVEPPLPTLASLRLLATEPAFFFEMSLDPA